MDDTDISSDPQFIDPDNDDFRLRAGSPCRNAGYAPVMGYSEIGAYGFKSIVPNARGGVYANPRGVIAR